MEHVQTRLAELLGALPAGAPTSFAVRSHAVAAALYREGLAEQIPRPWHTDSIEVARTESASLVLERYRGGHARAARLVESDRHMTLLNLGPGSLDLLIYRTIEAKDGPSPESQVLAPIFRTLSPGEVLATIAGQEIIDVIPAEETVVAWILSSPANAELREYDRQTGVCIGMRKIDKGEGIGT